MTSLHALFSLRNQQAFQRLLEASRASSSSSVSGLSTSGGRSWNKPSPLNANAPTIDINSRDWLGRTVLHLTCSASDVAATEYVRLLLAHPAINVNAQDTESHWTPLHRAMYNGNLATAALLLQHSDTDASLKDLEGYTAADLYNSTIEGTKMPVDYEDELTICGPGAGVAELYTWGQNRNAALGSGTGDDRNHPEPVILRPLSEARTEALASRLAPIHVVRVAMSKLHTAIVTDEARNNVRVCGFGGGGRLGPGQHIQYDPITIQQLPNRVVAVAVGQDHTLALTEAWEVYSWGLNHFSQLGYVIEQATGGEQIQAVPKKIYGLLRNKKVYGIAACKTASACFTWDEVYTWGTNNGQLGYDKNASPVQPLPHVVTKISGCVRAIAITNSAMACVLDTGEVICFWNDRHFKINFQIPLFPAEVKVHHSMSYLRPDIVRIATCDNTFAALSRTGELFTFAPPNTATDSKESTAIKPQRVWALIRQSAAVKDFALGSDGSMIICTESGHVFVRSRNLKLSQTGGKAFKFQRIALLQRVVSVCANSTGAFGALRVDFRPQSIEAVGNKLPQDMAAVQPFLALTSHNPIITHIPDTSGGNTDDEEIQNDIRDIIRLCCLIYADRVTRKESGHGLFDGSLCSHGPDLKIQVQSGFTFPAHRVVLAARCPSLARLASGLDKTLRGHDKKIVIKAPQPRASIAGRSMATLAISGCEPLSVLVLLVYLYSDNVLAVWDPRISMMVEPQVGSFTKVSPDKVKIEVQALAWMLDLPRLAEALQAPVKKMPAPTIVGDFRRIFQESQEDPRHAPDVILELVDKVVYCHSLLLRARSPLFTAFFDDKDWTEKRWGPDGTIVVNLRHLRWREMEFVVRFMCCGDDEEMFDNLAFINSIDELLDLMFDVIAAATELLLDRLVSICSAIILRYININNVCFAFAEATHYTAHSLIQKLQLYMAVNMETLLESHMLDDLSPELIRQLSSAVRAEQARKAPYTRSTKMVERAMESFGDWLALQDIPQPVYRSHKAAFGRGSVKLSPPTPTKRKKSGPHSPMTSPVLTPFKVQSPSTAGVEQDIFIMDDDVPTSPLASRQLSSKPSLVWRALSSTPRSDMKSIMAEAESKKVFGPRTPPSSGAGYPDRSPRTPQRTSSDLESINRTPPGSSWRVSVGAGQSSSSSSSEVTLPTAKDFKQPPGSPSGIARDRPEPLSRQQTPTVTATLARSQVKSPGLGPVITPARQLPPKSSPSTPRRVSGSSSNPWTAPVVKPVLHANTAPGATTSFATIQLLQQEEDFSKSTSKVKRSLKEIQEEERAQRAEEEFMKWWAAEEERVQLEAIAAAAEAEAIVSAGKKGPSKGRKRGPIVKKESENTNGNKKNAGNLSGRKTAKKVDPN